MMRTRLSESQLKLFDLPPQSKLEAYLKQLGHPLWTENKARLIARYLYYFVLVTKHGSYIDGFAGPQKPDKPETWSAKLVIENEPCWFRHFFFFEKDGNQYERLQRLKESQKAELQKKICLCHGDFNSEVSRFLAGHPIGEKEATFCLLDQRTFECHWSTLMTLARYKKEKMKIELFYFLSASWFDRAMSASRDKGTLLAWWGKEDWVTLRRLKSSKRADLFCDRIKSEFKYASVIPWPIYDRKEGGRVMYNMIHATDHPIAPNLMYRAYHTAVRPKEPMEQLEFEFKRWSTQR
jgi:three-Cys-motif partner protein